MDTLDSIRRRIMMQQVGQQRRRKLLIALALLLLSLISVTAGYAIYQTVTDPGLEAVQDAGLVTPLNLRQESAGLTMSVTQGYADANRVAVWYTLEKGDQADDLALMPGLFHAGEDEWFGTGGLSSYPDPEAAPGTISGIMTFDHAEPVPADGLYNLRLEVRVERQPAPSEMPVSGEYNPADFTITTFSFDLQLPGIEAVELTPQQRVTVNEVEITLESLRISPSQMALVMCYDVPSAQDWQPNVTVMIDDEPGLLMSMGIEGGKESRSLDSPRRCVNMHFVLAYTEESDTLLLVVDRLQTSVPEVTPEVLDEAARRLAEQGIIVEFWLEGRGMGYEIISAPDGLPEHEIGMRVFDSMRDFYPGPWRFEVALP